MIIVERDEFSFYNKITSDISGHIMIIKFYENAWLY